MKRIIVLVTALTLAGCASQRLCIDLLEKAESKSRSSFAGAKREVPEADSDKKWKAVLNDFGAVQGYADESKRRYLALMREDPDKNALLRAELEKIDYFRRLDTVYACSLRMQGIALYNLGNYVYSEQKMSSGDLAARESQDRYKYRIDCGYPMPQK